MKRFEAGKTYKVYDKGSVTVLSRTRCYVTIDGLVNGRFMVTRGDLFHGSEYVLLPAADMGHGHMWACVADDVLQ